MRAHAVLLVIIACASFAIAEPNKQKRRRQSDAAAFKTRKRVCGLVIRSVPKIMACKLRVIDGVEVEPPTDVLKQWKDAPSSETDPKVTAMCADMLYGYQYEAAKKKCSLGLAAGDQALIADTLARWHSVRTTPSPTNDAAIDKNLAALVKLRDAVCACPVQDQACLARTNQAIDDAIPPEATTTDPTLRRISLEYSEAIVEEARRCKHRLEFGIYESLLSPPIRTKP